MLMQHIKVSRRKSPLIRSPTLEDFSDKAVQKQVNYDIWISIWTLLPTALGLSMVLFGIINHIPPVAIVGIIFGPTFGLIGALCNAYFRSEKYAKDYVNYLLELRSRGQSLQIADLISNSIDNRFAEGVKEAKELEHAYVQLINYISDKSISYLGLSADRVRVMAEECYQEGLANLQAAYDIFIGLKSIDIKKLKLELQNMEAQLQKLVDKDYTQTINAKIASHQQRIESYKRRHRDLLAHLAEADKREAALEQARLEAGKLLGSNETIMNTSYANTGSKLEQHLKAALAVERRIRENSSEITEELKQQYLRND